VFSCLSIVADECLIYVYDNSALDKKNYQGILACLRKICITIWYETVAAKILIFDFTRVFDSINRTVENDFISLLFQFE